MCSPTLDSLLHQLDWPWTAQQMAVGRLASEYWKIQDNVSTPGYSNNYDLQTTENGNLVGSST